MKMQKPILYVLLAGELAALWIKEEYNIPFVVTEHSTGFARNIYSTELKQLAKKFFENSKEDIV